MFWSFDWHCVLADLLIHFLRVKQQLGLQLLSLCPWIFLQFLSLLGSGVCVHLREEESWLLKETLVIKVRGNRNGHKFQSVLVGVHHLPFSSACLPTSGFSI